MKRLACLLLLAGCVTTPPPPRVPEVPPVVDAAAAPRATVDAFLAAIDAQKFEDVHALLIKPLRDRYDVARLKADFEGEPNARQRVDAIRAARSAAMSFSEGEASLPLTHERQLRLVREGADWKIAALE